MKNFGFNLTALLLALMFSASFVNAQPASKTVSGPNATFQRTWVDYDVTEGSKRGMRIHTAFKVFGMKGIGSYLQIKFQKRDGTPLMDNNNEFDHEDGSVAAFVKLRPGFDPAVFEDEPIFMPYAELDLAAGKYELRMDIDVIKEDGELVSHLTFYNFDFTQPAKTTTSTTTGSTSATFQKIWVDYDVTEGGKRGMRIHTAFKAYGMKGVSSYLQIKFMKGDTPLKDKNGEFVAEDGSVAAFGTLKPGFDPAVYEDFDIFMPYAELDLTSGKHNLKMDVDVIYENGDLIQHLTMYEFEYTKP